MFHASLYTGNPEEDYAAVIRQLAALTDGETDIIANLANASALLNQFLTEINWVGFYLYDKETDQLVLGPFQGLPACVRIPLGRGVCGTAARERATQLVANVHEFPGHIACDAASLSEIVVPLVKDGELLGVLDIDSPVESRFNEVDRQYLEQFVQQLLTCLPRP